MVIKFGDTKMSRAPILCQPTVLLATALLAMFTAQGVLAHGDHSSPCQGPHKNDAECDGSAAPDPWHLVVEDSTGAFVGIPMESGPGANPWDDDFTVFVAVPAPDGGSAIFVRIQSQMIMSTHGRAVLYTDMDCGLSGGTPYRVSPQVDALGRDLFDGRDSLYVVPDKQPVETPRLLSIWQGAPPVCSAQDRTEDAQQLAPIGFAFVPPFSLQMRQR